MFSFDKLKASASRIAKQSVQAISNIASTVIENTTAGVNSGISSGGYIQVSLTKEELQNTFDNIIHIIHDLSKDQDIGATNIPFETDVRLNYSRIGLELKKLIQILKLDSEKWLVIQRRVDRHKNDPAHVQNNDVEVDNMTIQAASNIILEESDIPCIDHFIQSNMIQTLCNHVQTDIPRGIMPLMLKALTLLFKSVPYPLLPHQSIHRPIAKLISTATRYDAFIGVYGEHNKTSTEKEQYDNYRKRIDITLTGLLKVLWRKVLENPPVLDYFILTDKRALRLGIENGLDAYKSPKNFKPAISPAEVNRMQIDMLYALLPLIYEPKLSVHVQESILIALHLPDDRIQQFLATNTKLVEILVTGVCESFKEALANLVQQQQVVVQQPLSASCVGSPVPNHLHLFGNFAGSSNSNPISASFSTGHDPMKTPVKSKSSAFVDISTPTTNASTAVPSQSQPGNETPIYVNGNNPGNGVNQEDESNSLVKFSKTVSFLQAVYAVVSQQVWEKLQQQRMETAATINESRDICDEQLLVKGFYGPNLMIDISETFAKLFLQHTLTPCLDTAKANECYNTALYTLLRIMLALLQQGQDSSSLPSDSSYDIVYGAKENVKVHTTAASNRPRSYSNSTVQNVPRTIEATKLMEGAENEKYEDLSQKHRKELSVNTKVSPHVMVGNGQIHHIRALRLSLLSQTTRFLLLASIPNSTAGVPDAAPPTSLPSSVAIPPDLKYSSFFWSLMDRMSSYSKSLSVASMQLVNQLLVVVPPHLLQDVVIHSCHPDSNYTCTEAKVFAQLDLKAFSLDDAICRACKSIEFERNQSTRQLVVSTTVLTAYIDQSAQVLLHRLLHVGDSACGHRPIQGNPQTSFSASPNSLASSSNTDQFLDRVLKKLQSYMTLRVDEQLVLSGLLRETISTVAMSIFLVPRSSRFYQPPCSNDSDVCGDEDETIAKKMLARLLVVLKKVTVLKNEMVAQHLKQIPDSLKKLELLREYLIGEVVEVLYPASGNSYKACELDGAGDTTPNHVQLNSKEVLRQLQIRRFLENESMDSKRILVGVYILLEIQAEIQAYLFAIQVVRRAIIGHDNLGSAISTNQHSQSRDSLSLLYKYFFDVGIQHPVDNVNYVNPVDREEFEEIEQDAQEVRDLVKTIVTNQAGGTGHSKKSFDIEKLEYEFLREYQLIENTIDKLASRE